MDVNFQVDVLVILVKVGSQVADSSSFWRGQKIVVVSSTPNSYQTLAEATLIHECGHVIIEVHSVTQTR
jgi:hypothetical protein